MTVCRTHGTEVSQAKMNMLLHFLYCFGRRKSCGEADTALLPAKPIQSLGLQLLGLEWWCCWVICELLGSSLAGPFSTASQTPHAAFVAGNSWCGQLLAEKLCTSWECDVGLCEAPQELPCLWGACPAPSRSSLACWQLNMESASSPQSWDSHNVDVCVLPGMQTVFWCCWQEMNGMEIGELDLHNYSHLEMLWP